MRRYASGLAFVLLLVALAASLPGCGGARDAGKRENGPAGSGAGCGEPVVITTAKALRDYDVLRNGDTIDDNPITRWAKERLCVVQTNKWLVTDQNEALADRIKSSIAGGEALPDVLFLTNHDLPELLDDLAASGKIMDVGEPFERYAPERIKAAYARNPDVWRTVALDG